MIAAKEARIKTEAFVCGRDLADARRLLRLIEEKIEKEIRAGRYHLNITVDTGYAEEEFMPYSISIVCDEMRELEYGFNYSFTLSEINTTVCKMEILW